MQKTKTTIQEYIDSLPAESQSDISTLNKEISQIIPDQVMWEGVFWGGSAQRIIGYGDFRYKRSDKETVEWFKVGLALQKNYITVFVNAVEDGQYVAEKYKSELGKVKVGKSSISFKSLADVDMHALLKVVQKAKELNSQQ